MKKEHNQLNVMLVDAVLSNKTDSVTSLSRCLDRERGSTQTLGTLTPPSSLWAEVG